MTSIFISYRTRSSRADAGRLYDRLAAHFGDDNVFMDVDDIDPGQNFVEVLNSTLDSCNALIVLIGQGWTELTDEHGRNRLQDPRDFVRIEIQRALQRGIKVVPVLVGGATMPTRASLPDALKALSQHQAIEISDARFHHDVDRLIDSLHGIIEGELPGRRFSLRWGLLAVGALVVLFATYFAYDWFGLSPQRAAENAINMNVGDQLASRGDYAEAMVQYRKVVEDEPGNTVALRKLVTMVRERVQQAAFIGTSVDMALRRDYKRFKPVEDKHIDEGLGYLYSLRARDARYQEDTKLALEEALILKTSGARAEDAIAVLKRAYERSPEDPDVLAELGLLTAVILEGDQGVALLQKAIGIAPRTAMYRFYLARSLSELHDCAHGAPNQPTQANAEGCANAILNYYEAGNLAVGPDKWSKRVRVRSVQSALGIFHRYARKEYGIVTPDLDLTLDARIRVLSYFIPLERTRYRTGWEDEPRFWLATLYENRSNLEAAQALMRELLEEKGYRSVVWMKLYASLLRRTGDDPQALSKVEQIIAKTKQ